MNKDTSGPAFPCKDIVARNDLGHLYGHEVSGTGMSLRDYFAAKAMQGVLSSPSDPDSMAALAEWSYRVADAMLEARCK